jgi:AraC family transcriptional activator of pobA
MTMRSRPAAIPIFQLYGEAEAQGVGEAEAQVGFVHLETISARAGLHNWEIRPHRHADLHQYLLVLKGSGRFGVDGAERAAIAPVLICVPPTLVHAFVFEPDTEGHVLTVSDVFLERALGGSEPIGAPAEPLVLPVASHRDLGALKASFEALDHEFHWPRPGRTRAIAAHLNLILIAAARLAEGPPRDAGAAARQTALTGALRALIHDHAAENWTVQDYARALSVSPSRLTAACKRATGRSPMQLAHDRLLVEAKRNLIYTSMSVQEIGFALGFADPAYFSRFFTQRQGISPRRYREQVGASQG